MDEKKLLEEIEKYREILKKDPASKGFIHLADALRRLKKFEEAEKVCEDGMKLNPNYHTGKIVLAKIYKDQGKNTEALEKLNEVLTKVPDNPVALRLKGEICFEMGQYEESLRSFERCFMIAPDEPGIEELMERAKEKVDESKEAQQVEELSEKGEEGKEEDVQELELQEEVQEASAEQEEEGVIQEALQEEEFETEEGRTLEEVEEAKEEEQEEARITQGVEEAAEEEVEKEALMEKESIEPEVVEKSPEPVRKKLDISEAKEFAFMMEKEGNLSGAFKLWMEILKEDPGNVEAKRKIAEIRSTMVRKKPVKGISNKDKNLELLAQWIKKIKEGG